MAPLLQLLWLPLLLVAAGCASLSPGNTDDDPSPAATLFEVPPVPDVDLTRHSVPLEDIYFDTFQPVNRAVPLSSAGPDLIERLRDAIPPIHNPMFQTASEVDWLRPSDLVLGYADQGLAWAFPIRILNFHEIVNVTLAGRPVLVSYCPLCYSGIVFDRRLDDRLLTFGNTSALYESDMVMLDYETGSYWWQVAGEAIVGQLTGSALQTLPSQMTTWEQWLELYPDTLVLSRETGHDRDYSRDPFAGYAGFLDSGQFAFPVTEASRDARLLPSARVLVVVNKGEARAYSLEVPRNAVLLDVLGGEPIVILIDVRAPSGTAFRPVAEGISLTLEVRDGTFYDVGTGSEWSLAGVAVAGPLAGARLAPVPVKTTFWFAAAAAHPGISLGSQPD